MASIRIIPVVLLLTILAVQSLLVDDSYKNLISLNGFEEEDALHVHYVIYETKNNSTGIERELNILNYVFNGVACQPNVVDIIVSSYIRFFGAGQIKFSKNRPAAVDHKGDKWDWFRFDGWAANRSHIEVTEDPKKIPAIGRYLFSSLLVTFLLL